jgi:outer membrane immunogenic protein
MKIYLSNKKGNETMKQTLKIGTALAVLALGTTGVAQANTHESASSSNAFNGFNIGLHGGYVGQTAKFDVSTVVAPTQTNSTDIGGQGFMGGLFLGWGHVFSNVHHFGIEASAKFANIEGKKSTLEGLLQTVDHRVKQTQAHDLTLRYGPVVAQKVLPFIKLGVAYGKWKGETAANAVLSGGKKDNSQVGFIVGAGVEFALSSRFSMGGEYTYTHFKDFTYDALNNAAPAVALRKIKVRPSSNAFMIRAKFKIG